MTTSPSDPQHALHRRLTRHPRRAQAALAAVWLVFLAIPGIMILQSSASSGIQALAWAGLVAFAAVYVASFTVTPGRTQTQSDRQRGLVCALLALCCALMWPAIRAGVIATMPYFGSVLLFFSPIRRAPWIVLGCTAAALAVSALDLTAWMRQGAYWNFVGPLIGLFCVTAGRFAEHSSEKKEQAERALAITEERSRIGRDVHDLLGHSLTVIAVKAELASRLVETDPSAARRELREIHELTREGLAQVRGTVTDLRSPASTPPEADPADRPSPSLSGTLAAASSTLASAGVVLSVTGTDPEAVPAPAADLFAWVLREGTTNILRHSGARTARLHLTERSLTLENDADRPLADAPFGHGLAGLQSRVSEHGGMLTAGPVEGQPQLYRMSVTIKP